MVRRLLLLACAAVAPACNEDVCDFGQLEQCHEPDPHAGPNDVRYCQPDGTWSECVPVVECNPLTQQRCERGLACYFESPWTFCALPDTYPCEPTRFTSNDHCADFCAHDGRDGDIRDPADCSEGNFCVRNDALPDGVGQCGDQSGGE